MASTHINVPISRITKDITMTLGVSGLRVMRFRFWVGSMVVRLAALIMGVGFKVELDGPQQ
jgi:tetrahydromethanopterin S-methyltransferase subunit B